MVILILASMPVVLLHALTLVAAVAVAAATAAAAAAVVMFSVPPRFPRNPDAPISGPILGPPGGPFPLFW